MSHDTVFFDSIMGFNSNLPLVIEMNQGTYSPSLLLTADNLDWSCYYGGDKTDVIHDITNDGLNTYITGFSGTINLPFLTGYHSLAGNSYGGGTYDAFYVKFDELVQIKHRTYFGGTSTDYGFGIACGRDIVIVGKTLSNSLPNISSAGMNDQTVGAIGKYDGFIFAVDPTGQNAKCDSYIGGTGDDICWAISTNPGNGTKYAIGGSTTEGILTTYSAGSYYQDASVALGEGDGFVIRLNGSFYDTWSSLLASDEIDEISGVAISDVGNIVAYGYSEQTVLSSSSNTYPTCDPPTDGSFPICIRSGAYNQSTMGAGYVGDMFLVEFNSANKMVWSTPFGTDGQEVYVGLYNYGAGGLAVDPNDNIYVTGGIRLSAGGLSFPTLSGGSYSQITAAENNTAFIGKFENRDLAWYTLYGGNSYDGSHENHTVGADITVDNQGYIFVIGNTSVGDLQAIPNYCTVPTSDEFPLCNQSNYAHMETDFNYSNLPTTDYSYYLRTFIAGFDPFGQIVWSTRYGNGTGNEGKAITTTAQDNKVYIAGLTVENTLQDYTLRQLYPGYPNDHYQDVYGGGLYDGVVARFSGSLVLATEDITTIQPLGYPNPTTDYFNIKIQEEEASIISTNILIFDISGKQVLCSFERNLNSITFNMENLLPGLYFIKLMNTQSQHTYKVIKM